MLKFPCKKCAQEFSSASQRAQHKCPMRKQRRRKLEIKVCLKCNLPIAKNFKRHQDTCRPEKFSKPVPALKNTYKWKKASQGLAKVKDDKDKPRHVRVHDYAAREKIEEEMRAMEKQY